MQQLINLIRERGFVRDGKKVPLSDELYYRTYWWITDLLDALFVKEVMRRMKRNGERCGALYIHPNGESPPVYVIVNPDALEWHPSNHSHVEGRS